MSGSSDSGDSKPLKIKKSKKDKTEVVDAELQAKLERKALRKAQKAAVNAPAAASMQVEGIFDDGKEAKKLKKLKKAEQAEDEVAPVKGKKGKKRERTEELGSEEQPVKRIRTRSMDVKDALTGKAAAPLAKAANLSIDQFEISDQTKAALRKRGIESLFPIQAQTYDKIKAGHDLIGRARTGMGKTLAFALPVIEKLLGSGELLKPRRPPRCIVMAPTRELAKQVGGDFEQTAPKLRTTIIYGGAPYRPQEDALRSGVDIVVGTPGRILDHLERGTLKLGSCEFIVLDEADQMLDMGFKEDMEKVFTACGMGSNDGRRRQVLLFSATMPAWVKQVSSEYMTKDKVYIDLVGDSNVKASQDVKHVAVPCHWTTRASTIGDLIAVYAPGDKRTLVFCQTKKECNEMCVAEGLTFECQALHGDITQANREIALAAFKKGTFRVLVATDVAARGLDMIVDLVINQEPPSHLSGRVDTETYVHRSGRTGRAGRKGVCVTLYTPKQRGALQEIERVIGNKLQWRGAPQPDDILEASAVSAVEEINSVSEQMYPYFEDVAKQLIQQMGAEAALCAALACVTGHKTPMRARSLLSNSDDFVTVLFKSDKPITYLAYCWGAIRRHLSPECCDAIRGMQITQDELHAVFDCPADYMEEVNEVCQSQDWLEIAKELPALKVRADEYENNRRQSRGGGFGGGFGRGRGSSRGRGGGGRGGSRGRGRGRGGY